MVLTWWFQFCCDHLWAECCQQHVVIDWIGKHKAVFRQATALPEQMRAVIIFTAPVFVQNLQQSCVNAKCTRNQPDRAALPRIHPLVCCRLLITKNTLQQLIALDTADAWDASTWEAAEPFLKAAASPAAQELMPQECPESCIGSIITLLLQQVHLCTHSPDTFSLD